MTIIKGTIEAKIVTLGAPDSIKYIQGREALGIIGGEFAITKDIDEIPIATLLGSCVAVMVYDSILKVKGMNHFLLPISQSAGASNRFGLNAMETMLNEMYKLGCRKENLTAKIAGGATILRDLSDNIGERNVMFARSFCRSEGIRVASEHVLGGNGRVVMVDSDFKTIVRTITNRTMDEKLAQNERVLAATVQKQETKVVHNTDITLF